MSHENIPPGCADYDGKRRTAGGPSDDRGVLIDTLNVLLRRRRLVVVAASVFVIPAVAAEISVPRTHSASATFVSAAGEDALGRLVTLAERLGMRSDEIRGASVTELHARLLTSDHGLGRVVEQLRRCPSDPVCRAEAVRTLRKRTRVESDPLTGAVHVAVEAKRPGEAVRTVEILIEGLEGLLRAEARSRYAQTSRLFSPELTRAREELAAAERRLVAFESRTRSLSGRGRPTAEGWMLMRDIQHARARELYLSSLVESVARGVERPRRSLLIVDPPHLDDLRQEAGVPARSMVLLALGLVFASSTAHAVDALKGTRA